MIKTENRKTSDDFETDAFRMATIVENEKEKFLYIYEQVSELINLINQQKAVSEKFKDLYLETEILEQRKQIEISINLLKDCLGSLTMCMDSYDTIKEKAMNLLKIGCDIPIAF